MTEENSETQQINADSQTQENIKSYIPSELKQELELFRVEINFAAKALDTRAGEMGGQLSQSLLEFDTKLKELEAILKKHIDQEGAFAKEFNTFCLLPEKLSDRVQNIVPQIAKELATIVGETIEPIRQKLEASLVAQQEKLNILTTQLTEEAIAASSSYWKKFLMRLMTITIVAIGISALTSYLVTTKYPRFIEITGARDVIVQDSNLSVYGGKVKDN